MNIAVLVPLFLVLLGFAWGFWLIFRKGDMVSQPMKMMGYFVGALLALLIAGFLTVIIFPAWANQLLGIATESSSVQSFQDKTQELLDQSLGEPTARPPATVPTSPVSTPSTTTKPGVAPAAGQRTHVVQLGDTLSSLSRKYGVSVQAIQSANGIVNANDIKAGQTLIIPNP